MKQTRYALISVSKKDGVVEFAKFLNAYGIRIISTGGTFNLLKKEGLDVIQVKDLTHSEEILDGRVKTLHPIIHGGLLADLDVEEHVKTIVKNNISPIEFVVINLYPFEDVITNQNCKYEDAVENIDIGGPSMLRSGAKNHKHVTVIFDPNDYEIVKKEIIEYGKTTISTRKYLANKVFAYTSYYDAKIAQYFSRINNISYLDNFAIPMRKVQSLRYGENPHQDAAVYEDNAFNLFTILKAKQIHGKELSYNNINDANAAINIVRDFSSKKCYTALKHTNPCGVGIDDDEYKAWRKCYEGDKISIFGGIIATNTIVTPKIANELNTIFLEIIIAQGFTKEAEEILKTKKNLRLLILDFEIKCDQPFTFKSINGGVLYQDSDFPDWKDDFKNWHCVTKRENASALNDLHFAWKICKHLKSNAICVAQNGQLLGIGVGQTNRVQAVKLALESNKEILKNAVLASDAFFPMPDSIELISQYPIVAIAQTGGSIKDKDVIEKCNQLDLVMYLTGKRHFLH
ncbi:MAG: bifunctional phosphoribosylaminoimidazolecarboxamide formyltransferase/IMP cyclohydrolase [Mycoplasma sp.]